MKTNVSIMYNKVNSLIRRLQRWTIVVLLLALLAALAVLATGCGSQAQNPPVSSTPQTLEATPTGLHEPSTCGRPVRISLVGDQTLSGVQYGIELPDRDDLDRAASIVEHCSGELAFGIVASDGSMPLKRFRVDPSPYDLHEPQRVDYPDAFSFNDALAKYRRDAKGLKKVEAKRQADIAERKRKFLDDCEQVLSQGATYTSTDLNAIIQRSSVYHAESTASWGRDIVKYALFASDGEHNAVASHADPLPADVQVLLVFGSTDGGLFADYNPPVLPFESVEAAVTYIYAKEVGR